LLNRFSSVIFFFGIHTAIDVLLAEWLAKQKWAKAV
jgi:uncharacterized protein (DUF2062 family)